MRDRSVLQTIKLIKSVLVRHKTDEVEDVIIFSCWLSIFIHDKWVLSSEAIMGNPNLFTVANRVSLIPRWQAYGETAQILQFISEFDLWPVHKDGQNCLRGTCIIDHLVGEEELWVVVGQSLGLVRLLLPLEKEDQSVDGPIAKNLVNITITIY